MNLLKDKEFNKKLFSLVLPIAFQQFMLNLVSASDAIMLGAIGQNELSAVSLAGQVQFVLGLFLAAVTIGTSIFAAQYWGKQDIDSVEKVFAIALRIAVPISAVFMLCTAAFPASIMRIFTGDELLIASGAKYLRAASTSYFFCGISQVYLCIMKNCGLAVKCTIITSVSVVLNAVLNAFLIFGLFFFPELGIAGAALATSIARFVEVCWGILALKKTNQVRLHIKYLLHADERLHKDFWKYTSPVLANELVWGIGFTMSSVIMGHLGTDATAANSIASITKNLVVCFCIGLGSGGGIIVGNELGAGNLETAKEYGGKLCRLSVLSGALSGIVILIASPLILQFTSLSAQSTEYLKWMLVICSYYIIGKAINCTTIAGIFCAGGDSKFGFLCDTVAMWGIIVPLGLISAFVLDLSVMAVYFLINLDELLKVPAVYKHYTKYIWVKDLTIKENES
ncbi:MAG: MATE family efflux transporter [Ruminococcus sp.]|nr:MATE family efflux transporter [Ruminococcus sp.]